MQTKTGTIEQVRDELIQVASSDISSQHRVQAYRDAIIEPYTAEGNADLIVRNVPCPRSRHDTAIKLVTHWDWLPGTLGRGDLYISDVSLVAEVSR